MLLFNRSHLLREGQVQFVWKQQQLFLKVGQKKCVLKTTTDNNFFQHEKGRISPEDAGIWTDTQIPQLKRIVDFVHTQGTKIGIQLAHAGRKASTLAPWVAGNLARTTHAGRNIAYANENGWPDDGTWRPSLFSMYFVHDFP